MEWIFYAILKKTPEECAYMTPTDVINIWNGYRWRRQQQENMLAALVTVYIANYAGKSSKKTLKLQDIFSDGRFDGRITDDDRAFLDELYGGGESDG